MDVSSFLKAFKNSQNGSAAQHPASSSAADESTDGPVGNAEDSVDDFYDATSDASDEHATSEDDALYEHRGGRRLPARLAYTGEGKSNTKEFDPLKVFSTNAQEGLGKEDGGRRHSARLTSTAAAQNAWQRGIASRAARSAEGCLKRLRSTSADAYWKDLLAERNKLAAEASRAADTASSVGVSAHTHNIVEQIDRTMINVDELLSEERTDSAPLLLAPPAPSVKETSKPDEVARHSPHRPESAEVAKPEASPPQSTHESVQSESAVSQKDADETRAFPGCTRKVSMFARAKALHGATR